MRDRTRELGVSVFFIALVALGAFIYQDYGISWDEPQQRLIGQVAERYVVESVVPFLGISPHPVPDLHDFRDKDYGVVFELPAVLLERLFGLEDTREIFFLRHFLTYLVFLAGVFAVYRMVERRLGDWRLGLLAATFLVLSPRFFAEGFYNSKDIVFMAMFAIALASMLGFLQNPNTRTALLHGFATGLAVDIRIMAVLIPLVTTVVITLKIVRHDLNIWGAGKALSLYWLFAAVFTYGMSPFLWEAPVANFIQTFDNMSQFGRWGGEVLYLGDRIPGDTLPWHYAPVWIGVTTPLLFLGLFLVGVFAIIGRLLRAGYRMWVHEHELQDLLMLAFVLGPLVAVIVFQSVLYSGWRHLYFVYPAFLFVAMVGLSYFWRLLGSAKIGQYALASVIVAAPLAYQAHWMWRAHPLQNVYFNALAGSEWRFRFEVDYWGLSNRDALEWILANDGADRITVVPGSFTPLHYSVMMLTPEQRARLNVPVTNWPQQPSGPHYVVDNFYYWERHHDPSRYQTGYVAVHHILVGGEVIASIYRRLPD